MLMAIQLAGATFSFRKATDSAVVTNGMMKISEKASAMVR